MSDLIKTHDHCPICGLWVPLTETGKMRKGRNNPKHAKCIGDGKQIDIVRACLQFLNVFNSNAISDTHDALTPINMHELESFLIYCSENLYQLIHKHFNELFYPHYHLQQDTQQNRDAIINRFRQAVTASRAAMGTPKGP